MFQNLHSLRPGVRTLGTAALTLALAGISVAAQAAPPVRPLHSFNGNDGTQPANGLVVAPDGSLYGDTDSALGNTNHSVTDVIYKTRPDGTGLQILHTFPGTSSSGVNSDGSAPNRLLLVGGFLYGTTYTGGANGTGVIFKMDAAGGNFQILHTFGPSSAQNMDGAGASSGLTLGPDGALYGAAFVGGTGGGGGVYKINPDGTGFQVLYAFSSSNGGGTGYQPNSGPVFGSDGSLYGTTQAGGATGNGTVYKLTPNSQAISVLHSFDSAGGFAPLGVIFGSDGNLYGTTFAGGPNSASAGGTLFQLTQSGAYQVIHSFTTGTGAIAIPLTPPTEAPDGTLYGATNGGGTAGLGVIYQVSKDGTNFQIAGSLTQTTGVSVGGALTIANRKVFGTARGGGASSDGTLFSLALPSLSHLVWNNTDGTQSLWTISPDLSFTYRNYGPYPGWAVTALADTPDGKTHLLWNHAGDNQISLWDASPDGSFVFRNYGPFSGWKAASMSAGPDGLLHLLWNHSPDGQMSLWSLDNAAGLYDHREYGPFPSYSAKAVATGGNGATEVLWNKTDGSISTWQVSQTDGSYLHYEYGPFAGWTANALAAGPDGLASIAWSSTDGTQSLWSADFAVQGYSFVNYGPYAGWSVTSLGVGADGGRRLLWSHPSDGQASVWSGDNTGALLIKNYGPYSGWNPVAFSVGQ